MAGGFDASLGAVHLGSGPLHALAGAFALHASMLDRLLSCEDFGLRRGELLLERGKLCGERLLAVALELRERTLERRDLLGRSGVVLLCRDLRVKTLQERPSMREASFDRLCGRSQSICPVTDSLRGRLGGEAATGELLALGTAGGERPLRRLAASGYGLQIALDPLAARS